MSKPKLIVFDLGTLSVFDVKPKVTIRLRSESISVISFNVEMLVLILVIFCVVKRFLITGTLIDFTFIVGIVLTVNHLNVQYIVFSVVYNNIHVCQPLNVSCCPSMCFVLFTFHQITLFGLFGWIHTSVRPFTKMTGLSCFYCLFFLKLSSRLMYPSCFL